jgi:hypothetical protein
LPYGLRSWTLGITVFMALGGTVIGAMVAGIPRPFAARWCSSF